MPNDKILTQVRRNAPDSDGALLIQIKVRRNAPDLGGALHYVNAPYVN